VKTNAASFRMSPSKRVRFNHFRLTTDVMGVTLMRLIDPLVQTTFVHTIFSIYNVMAWVTILTLDPTRIPEFTSTRNKQKKAWIYTLKWFPVIGLIFIIPALCFHVTVLQHTITPAYIMGIAISSFMDELLFRNTLQPALRKWGLSSYGAAGTQSLLYSLAIMAATHSIVLMGAAFLIGLVNGRIVYKYRSIWPVFLIGLIWRLLFT
jgi:membrane protease YdiL (CAAX protease family)